MKKLFVLFIFSLSFLFSLNSLAQDSLVYFDENWDTVPKEKAAFYRVPVKFNGTNYTIKDYYITGELQFVGASSSETEELLDGFCTWYYKNGKVEQTSQMEYGQCNGETVWFDPDGKEIARGMYSYDSYISGSFLQKETLYRQITTIDADGNQKVRISDVYGGSNASYEYFIKDSIYVYNFYDNSGKLLGSTSVNQNTLLIENGIVVNYNFNPLSVASITKVQDNKFVDVQKNFFSNGRIKSIEYFDDKTYSYYSSSHAAIVFFDINGKKLDSLIYSDNTPLEGIFYEYNSGISYRYCVTDKLKSEIPYKNGKIEGIRKTYYDNGKIEAIETYKNSMKNGLSISYDSITGAEIYKMKYIDDNKFEGTCIEDKTIYEYKNGELISQKDLFENGKTKSIKTKINSTEYKTIYYNPDGTVVGQCTLKNDQLYDGDYVEYDYYEDKINSVTRYQNGLVLDTRYFVNNKLLYTETNNGDQSFYDSVTNKTYHCLIKDGYPIEGEYVRYDHYSNYVEGIDTYKNGKKNGTSVSFTLDYYSQERQISLEETYLDDNLDGVSKLYCHGNILSVSNYENGYNVGTTFYYDENGDITDSLQYLNNLAYTGKYISFDGEGKPTSITEYKDSEIIQSITFYPESSDTLIKSVYSDSKSYTYYSYYSNSKLKEKYSIINDRIEGTVLSYTQEGNILVKGTYTDNTPSGGEIAFFDEYSDDENYVIIKIAKKTVEISYKNSEGNDDSFSISRKKGIDKLTMEGILSMLTAKFGVYSFTKHYSYYYDYIY